MRFKLQPSKELRDRGVQHKRIEQIDVIDQKKAGARRVKSPRPPCTTTFRTREFQNAAAEHELRAIVSCGGRRRLQAISKKATHRKEIQCGYEPVKRAASDGPGALQAPFGGRGCGGGSRSTGRSPSPFIPIISQRPGKHASSDSTLRVNTSTVHDNVHRFFEVEFDLRFAVRLALTQRRCQLCEPSARVGKFRTG